MPRTRSNYGIVGPQVQPLANISSGAFYSSVDVQVLKSAGEWVGPPTAPQNVQATTPGNASVSVTFTAPAVNGGSPITSYTVTSSPGNITGTGNSSPVTVSGLTNGTAYTFTATATNSLGTSPSSSASNSLKAGLYGTFDNPTTGNVLYNLSSVTLTTSGYYLFTPFTSCNVRIQLWGGGGGGLLLPGGTTTVAAGAGGYVEANVSLTGDTQYVVLVGAAGILGAATPPSIFPDGGSSNANNQLQGTGGGSSRFGPYVQSGFNITNSAGNYNNTNAVYWLIAGGGGGTTGYCSIGTAQSFGGGLTGSAGNSYFNGGEVLASCGGAGTQSAGGAGGTGGRLANGSAGAKYSGGFGTGGGGGGGYYGGGGAAGYYAVGGGGSGYIHSISSVTSGLFYTASAGANNYISPNPRSNKPGNAGNGNNPTASVSSGNAGAMIMTLL